MSKTPAFDIQVVEDHNEALNVIYEAIGAKKLDFDRLVLVHFDSHPDLGIPRDFLADKIYERDALLEALSIENWILPAVYAGHVETVVWIKPPWSTQIESGRYMIAVGKDPASGCIRCSCKESYFLSDGLYVDENSLENSREFTLLVCEIDDLVAKRDNEVYRAIQEAVKVQEPRPGMRIMKAAKRLILDIDLDFFSTQDPFKLMFKDEADFELFKRVYYFKQPSPQEPDFDSKYQAFLAERVSRLELIWSILSGNSNRKIETDHEVIKLKEAFLANQIDMQLVHEYGSCLDDRPLPHHVSDKAETDRLINQLGLFLSHYFSAPVIPNLVTVARSSLDDYCPVDQVDQIQKDTLGRLESHFGSKSIRSIVLNYLD